MAKRLKKPQQSKWIRRMFVLMSCVLVLICCAAPAFGYGVSYDRNSTLLPLLTGNITMSFFSNDVTPSYGNDKYDVSVVLPAQYDYFLNQNSFTDMADYINYYNKSVTSDSGTDSKDYHLDIWGGRWAVDVNGFRYWRVRTQIQSWQLENEDENAYFNSVVFDFDSFACVLDERILNEMFAVVATDKVNIVSSATITYLDDEGVLQTAGYRASVSNYGGTRRFCAFFDDDVAQTFDNWVSVNGLTVGQPIMVSDLQLEVSANKSSGVIARSDLTFEVLTHVFYDASNARPAYWQPGKSVDWFIRTVFDDINYGADNPIPPNYGGGSSSNEGNVWSQWLAGVVTGFFDAEILPDFSFGKVFSVIMVVIFVLIALKFFAG